MAKEPEYLMSSFQQNGLLYEKKHGLWYVVAGRTIFQRKCTWTCFPKPWHPRGRTEKEIKESGWSTKKMSKEQVFIMLL